MSRAQFSLSSRRTHRILTLTSPSVLISTSKHTSSPKLTLKRCYYRVKTDSRPPAPFGAFFAPFSRSKPQLKGGDSCHREDVSPMPRWFPAFPPRRPARPRRHRLRKPSSRSGSGPMMRRSSPLPRTTRSSTSPGCGISIGSGTSQRSPISRRKWIRCAQSASDCCWYCWRR